MKKLKTLISIFAVVALASISTGAPTPPPSFGTLPKNYQTVIRGYYAMPGHLLDPFSAVYRFETPRKGIVQDGILVGHKKHYGWIVPVWGENGNVGDVSEMFTDHNGKFLP
jgi:hypothetical protein